MGKRATLAESAVALTAISLIRLLLYVDPKLLKNPVRFMALTLFIREASLRQQRFLNTLLLALLPELIPLILTGSLIAVKNLSHLKLLWFTQAKA